jgi:hypothetical protein
VTPSQALLHEFSTQYLVDEMPRFTPEFLETVLPRWAKASALRLSGQVNDIDNLIHLADDLRKNPGHPMLPDLENATSIDWTEEWPAFTRLMELLIKSLRRLAVGETVSLGVAVYRIADGTEISSRLLDEDGAELLVIREPVTIGRTLMIRFESNDPKLRVGRASTLIAKYLLHDFLLDIYKDNVDIVEYLDTEQAESIRLPYTTIGVS